MARMNSDKRLFALKVVYNSGKKKLLVFETRKDMIDYDVIVSKRRSVFVTQRMPAQRGPSNVAR